MLIVLFKTRTDIVFDHSAAPIVRYNERRITLESAIRVV